MFGQSLGILPGIGPAKADLLVKEVGLATWGDLLQYFPYRYDDRSVFYTVRELTEELPNAQLKGILTSVDLIATGKVKRLVGKFIDEEGKTMQLVWFNSISWIADKLPKGVPIVVYGKPNFFRGTFSIIHPEILVQGPDLEKQIPALNPVYNLTEKLRKKGIDHQAIGKWIKLILDKAANQIQENIPVSILQNHHLINRAEAFAQIHFPVNYHQLEQARDRLKFEELFVNQLRLIRVRGLRKQQLQGMQVAKLNLFNLFYHNHLPFSLTEAQQRVLREVRKDMGSGKQMNRLIQGDVGSGKTIVAFMSMLMVVDNGYQACLMAPTEILAEQHFNGLQPLANAIGLPIAKLTGNTKSAERKVILEALATGQLPLIVGTHALLEPRVRFKQLGLSVIDEQHRFGVAQRARLWEKNALSVPDDEGSMFQDNNPKTYVAPHIMVMTATPIPRTLAMTLYGDLDVSVIDQLPPGRKPIKTSHVYMNQRQQVWNFMEQQIQQGRQIYVVYPLIEESEQMDFMALEIGYELLQQHFLPKQIGISMVHGKMDKAARDFEMDQFVKGVTKIMVATTVIEVGVNVPNASVMLIESAERFGLSQLHQLRGRVGRGADQSYCILMTDVKLSKDTRERLATMVRTSNGFEIAEVDLRLRGPGDILGTQQSGALNFKLANLATDTALMAQAREEAIAIIEQDPELELPEHQMTRLYLQESEGAGLAWNRVG